MNHMFGFLFALITTVSCSENLVQTLVFGKEDGSHFCDANLNPYRHVSNVTIFKVVDGNQDKAVPCCTVSPYASPSASNYFRIDIPDDLVKDGVEYSFQFELLEGDECYSESWTFDEDKQVFTLCSAIEKKFWKDRNYQIAALLIVLLVVAGGSSMAYRKIKKSRNSL